MTDWGGRTRRTNPYLWSASRCGGRSSWCGGAWVISQESHWPGQADWSRRCWFGLWHQCFFVNVLISAHLTNRLKKQTKGTVRVAWSEFLHVCWIRPAHLTLTGWHGVEILRNLLQCCNSGFFLQMKVQILSHSLIVVHRGNNYSFFPLFSKFNIIM